jgi:carboxypeptidase family protein
MRRFSTNLLGIAAVLSIAWGQYASPLPPPDVPRTTPQIPGAQEPAEQSKRAEHKVTGRVVDRDGTAVSKAEVRFAGPKKGRVWTDAAGEFSFTGPAGDYTITVKAGERQQEFTAKIADNMLDPSTLIIEPKAMER